jgi:hypothetical protein
MENPLVEGLPFPDKSSSQLSERPGQSHGHLTSVMFFVKKTTPCGKNYMP